MASELKNLAIGVPIVTAGVLTFFTAMGGFGHGPALVVMIALMIICILALGHTIGKTLREEEQDGA